MQTSLNVHLMGGEGTGWALDADLATTRESLSVMGDLIRFTDLDHADVVHSVWEWPLLKLPESSLVGKRVICHICNDLLRTYEQSCMIHAKRIGLWVPLSRKTEQQLISLGHRHAYVPYAFDTASFTPICPKDQTVKSLRRHFKIPEDRFVIGNFMRDTLGSNLQIPKDQKGVEVFLGIAKILLRRGVPIHILLAGPRRHWIRARLRESGIPLTYVGREIDGDDNSINILDPATINLLYHASDLHLVTSRWEGGPRAVLEAAATKTPIVCTPVGMAPDVLEADCLFESVDEGATIIERHLSERYLNRTIEIQFDRVIANHVPSANAPRFRAIYERAHEIPVYVAHHKAVPRPYCSSTTNPFLGWFRRRKPGTGLRVGLWHEFHKPPYGGGNQFMMSLHHALRKLGVQIEVNQFSPSIHVHLCNSAWFAVEEFMKAATSTKVPMIHRVDGPLAIYRGIEWTEDHKIYDLNTRLASATVYQSGWCFTKLHELGFHPVSPVIIHNATDSRIFHPHGRIRISPHRKIRLISTAWSDNPNKGGPFIKWLENHLDWNRFEYTFVGRSKETFHRIRHIPPKSSRPLARLLREHDIYIMASRHETCSNALIEALSCGLPALYLNDGGNGELTQFGGLPFNDNVDALPQLDRLANNYEVFQQGIHVQGIDEIARKYLELFQSALES